MTTMDIITDVISSPKKCGWFFCQVCADDAKKVASTTSGARVDASLYPLYLGAVGAGVNSTNALAEVYFIQLQYKIHKPKHKSDDFWKIWQTLLRPYPSSK